jgi:hypothetical protein
MDQIDPNDIFKDMVNQLADNTETMKTASEVIDKLQYDRCVLLDALKDAVELLERIDEEIYREYPDRFFAECLVHARAAIARVEVE